jgi:hypothetical protein
VNESERGGAPRVVRVCKIAIHENIVTQHRLKGGSDVGDRKTGHDPFLRRRPDVVQAMKHRQHYRRVAKTPEAMDENIFGAGFMDQA